MSVSRNKSIFIVFIDMLQICATLCMYLIDTKNYNVMFIFGTAVFVILLFSWIIDTGQIVNYFSILIVLIYLYTLGQYLLYYFNINIKFQYNIENIYEPKQINRAVLYVLINTIILHLSTIIFTNQRKKFKSEYVSSSEEQNAFLTASIILVNLSFVCKLIVLLFKIRLNLRYGYSVALGTSYNGAGPFSHIINFGATLFLPSIFAALVATKNKKYNFIFWIYYAIFVIAYFLSGSRFEAVISIAGLVLLYHFYYHKITIKQFILIGIIGVCVLFLCSLFNSIRIITNYGQTTDFAEIFSRSIQSTKNNNFLFDVIATTGFQILSVTNVLIHCPSSQPFSYGLYYLGGLIRIIPNIFGGHNILITESIDGIFTPYLTRTYGMGSSFIAEAYYNFGYFGFIVMIFYGYLIAFVCSKMNNIRKGQTKNIILIYFVFYMAAETLFWVRSDARMLLREIVFYYIGFKIFTKIVQGILKRKGKKTCEV